MTIEVSPKKSIWVFDEACDTDRNAMLTFLDQKPDSDIVQVGCDTVEPDRIAPLLVGKYDILVLEHADSWNPYAMSKFLSSYACSKVKYVILGAKSISWLKSVVSLGVEYSVQMKDISSLVQMSMLTDYVKDNMDSVLAKIDTDCLDWGKYSELSEGK